MRSLVRAVANLLRVWWAVDRIRASPAEARLLELQPPCVTMIEGETVEVLNRCVRETPEGPRIIYHCVRPGGVDRLLVIPGDLASRPVVRWAVEVIPSSTGDGCARRFFGENTRQCKKCVGAEPFFSVGW